MYGFLSLLHSVVIVNSLVEQQSNKNNLVTKDVVNSATKTILTAFQINNSTESKSKFKDFSRYHNFLYSLTLNESHKLNDIKNEIQVNSTNNGTDMVDYIDEILNEGTPNKNLTKTKEDVIAAHVRESIQTYLSNLEKYRNNIGVVDTELSRDLNDDIIKYVNQNNRSEFLNASFFEDSDSEENETVVDTGDTWRPSGRRIFKSTRTKIKHFPFMASIQIFGDFQCAGSIIKSDLVITAASCLQLAYNNRFFRENPRFLTVRVGSSFYVGGGDIVGVIEVYFYPTYDPVTLKNNLAIMRLERKIRFSYSNRRNVKKIDFDRSTNTLPTNNEILIVGWGARSASNIVKPPYNNRISYQRLPAYAMDDCKDVYSHHYITERNFCAGFLTTGGGACNMDVGNPGISNGILMGVVSFGSPVCGAPDAPTVFTKVGYYTDWIEEIMEQKVPTRKIRTTTSLRPVWTFPTPPLTTTRPKMAPLRIALDQNTKDTFTQFLETLFETSGENGFSLNDLRDAIREIGDSRKDRDNGDVKKPAAKKDQSDSDEKPKVKEVEPLMAESSDERPFDKVLTEPIAEVSSDDSSIEVKGFTMPLEEVNNQIRVKPEPEPFVKSPLAKTTTPKITYESFQDTDDEATDQSLINEEKKMKELDDAILTLVQLSDLEKKKEPVEEEPEMEEPEKEGLSIEPFQDFTYRSLNDTLLGLELNRGLIGEVVDASSSSDSKSDQ